MRERYFITISDACNVRQFSVHSLVARVLMYVMSGHTLLILVGLVALGWIAWQIDAMNVARRALAIEFQADSETLTRQRSDTESELHSLEKQIQKKRDELGIINRVSKPLPSSSSADGKVGAGLVQSLRPFLPMGAPMKGGQISSHFGMREHPIYRRNFFHNGIDIDLPQDSPVRATADGVVDAVEKEPGGFGLMVSIRHAYNFKTIYAHLHKARVATGQIVRKGDLVAESGNTGLSTAPHLHYEVRLDDKPINPYPFMKAEAEGIGRVINLARSTPWASLIASRQP